MIDDGITAPLVRFMLGASALCLFGGGALALCVSNVGVATTGAAFAIIGTPFSLLCAAGVWGMDWYVRR